MKNFASRGRRMLYPPRLMYEVDNILRDLHNSLHQTKAGINNCTMGLLLFIKFLNLNFFFFIKFLTSLPPRRLSSTLWPIFQHGFTM